eukprot:COSAG06_NODE_1328_length_9852_cov_590.986158_6_plen_145_part_00
MEVELNRHYTDLIFTTTTATMLTIAAVAAATAAATSYFSSPRVVRWDRGFQAQTARHNLELERRRPVVVAEVVARGPPRRRYNHVVRQRCSDYDLSVGQRVEYQINRRWLQATVRAFNRDGSVMLDLENGCLHRNADPAAAWPL